MTTAAKTRIAFYFSTRDYEVTHGHAPRGYGGWAFTFDGNREPTWAPASTYGDAKTWIKNHIRSIAPAGFDGEIAITVCT